MGTYITKHRLHFPIFAAKHQAMTSDTSLRKPGEMFTASLLKKATPFHQFIVALVIALLGLLMAKYVWASEDLILYAACFGIVFYIMFNPWLCLLTDNNRKYTITSFLLFFLITAILYGIVFFWTGKFVSNSWPIRIIIITALFYMVVVYAMMMALKLLFLDKSDGGM